MKNWLIACAVVGACTGVQAQESPWRFFAGLGMSNGGDTLISGTITTTGTGKVVPFSIKPGTGTQYRLGADYRVSDRFTVQGSIGRAVSDPMGIDGSLEFTTTPVEIMGFFNLTSALRLGAGVRQTSAEMTGSGKALGWSGLGTYNSKGGSVVETQYLFAPADAKIGATKSQFGLSLRWVNESFTRDSQTFDGNHYEVGLALYY